MDKRVEKEHKLFCLLQRLNFKSSMDAEYITLIFLSFLRNFYYTFSSMLSLNSHMF